MIFINVHPGKTPFRLLTTSSFPASLGSGHGGPATQLQPCHAKCGMHGVANAGCHQFTPCSVYRQQSLAPLTGKGQLTLLSTSKETIRWPFLPVHQTAPSTCLCKSTANRDQGGTDDSQKKSDGEEVQQKESAAVILLHGLGSQPSGGNTVALRDAMRGPDLEHVKWVHPKAPVKPVTCNDWKAMPSWFDVPELPETPHATLSDEEDVMEAVETVHELIDQQVEQGIDPSRIVVGGFSQGGATAVSSAATYPKPLAGAAVMWGWVPIEAETLAEKVTDEAKETPVLWSHGTDDGTVGVETGKRGAEVLSNAGLEVDLQVHPGAGHNVHKAELELVKDWILEKLPPEEKS